MADVELEGGCSSPITDTSLCPEAARASGESGCISQVGFEGLEVSMAETQDLRASIGSTEEP